MTQVRVTLNEPGPEGNVPTVVRLVATPTRRRTVGEVVVLPVPFSVPLVDGVVIVELAESGADWCWKIVEMTALSATSTTRYVAVPASDQIIGYQDLVDVDPDTLDPTVEPEAAWFVALEAALANRAGWVTVVTGTEPRPNIVPGVIWFDTRVDQSVAPTNMSSIDLWATEESVVDTTDPTVPTNLASSGITDTSFTVTWDAGTDDVGVAGYDWRIDGGAATQVAATPRSLDFTGRTASTAYTVELRTRDAAGNVSAWASIVVTTTGSALPTHVIFNTPPGALTKTVEASPYEHATAFYTYTATPTGWKVKGARLYVPVGVAVPETCEVNLYAPGGGTPTLGTPTKTVTMTGIVSGEWNSVDFPTVTVVNPGQVWWIGIKFADGTWLGVQALTADFVQAADGSNFVLADRVPDVGLDRNYRRIGTGATNALTDTFGRDLWFGLDATMEED